eukprot:TRINITY_DN14147_c0_g1_i1.p1 TRINITY_DN14147_c0_g1~~TRINITY_DN14147_c0_g1_i1.p1  ORF type:complete len:113 (-),score=16.77 TRINITY_DN14147_c0_g1_i1:37-375(-)
MDMNFLHCDVRYLSTVLKPNTFDTVIMNPPFGTKVKGIDTMFLQSALRIANNAVYSLHKTSTRQHIFRKAKEWGVVSEVLAELRFNLPKTFYFHKEKTVDIEVDFIRFYRKE